MNRQITLVLVSILIAGLVFVFDLSMPLGVAGGVPYVAFILVGFWFPKRRYVFILAIIASLLTLLGYYLSPPGGIPWIVSTNRGLALFAIWVTAILIFIHKEDQRTLLVSEARTEKFRQQLTDAIESISETFTLFDADDRLVLCNSEYKDFYPKIAHLIKPGVTFEELLDELIASGESVHAKDDPEGWKQERLNYHRNPKGNYILRLKDGRWHQISEHRTWDGGLVGIHTDITALKEAQERLERSEERYRQIAEVSSDWVWEMDENLRFSYVSPSFKKLTGIDPSNSIGKTRPETTSEDITSAHWQAHLEDLEARREFRNFRFTYQGPKGESLYFSINGAPVFDADNKFLGYRGTCTNVTDLIEAQISLRKAKEEAEVASIAKSEFLASMSHELRTPLNAIIGFSDTIQQEIFGAIGNEKYAEYINDIRNSGAHLLELINDILDVSAIEAGKLELHEEILDIGTLVEKTVRLIRPRAERRGMKLILKIPDSLPGIYGDERRLRQILLNLLSNAVKFTAEGKTLTLSVERKGELLSFIIDDQGIGMSDAELKTA
ncbi:MAG: PAS-domain containing protein, partial [Rhodospirillales bacterium]|nr:PAS-domain containing protein [Rhodospirillales bacterium]